MGHPGGRVRAPSAPRAEETRALVVPWLEDAGPVGAVPVRARGARGGFREGDCGVCGGAGEGVAGYGAVGGLLGTLLTFPPVCSVRGSLGAATSGCRPHTPSLARAGIRMSAIFGAHALFGDLGDWFLMDTSEALRILGLPREFALSDVEERFVELMKQRHRDIGGSDDETRALLEARDVLRESIGGASIAPLDSDTRIIVQDAVPSRTLSELLQRSQAAIDSVATVHVAEYRAQRRIAVVFGAVGAALAAVTSDLVPLFQVGGDASWILTAAGAIAAALFSIRATLLTSAAERVETTVKLVGEHLSERESWGRVWHELTSAVPTNPPWSREEIENLVREWIRPLRRLLLVSRLAIPRAVRGSDPPVQIVARDVGFRDFSRILIAKGIENGMLEEEEEISNGQLRTKYNTTIRGSERMDRAVREALAARLEKERDQQRVREQRLRDESSSRHAQRIVEAARHFSENEELQPIPDEPFLLVRTASIGPYEDEMLQHIRHGYPQIASMISQINADRRELTERLNRTREEMGWALRSATRRFLPGVPIERGRGTPPFVSVPAMSKFLWSFWNEARRKSGIDMKTSLWTNADSVVVAGSPRDVAVYGRVTEEMQLAILRTDDDVTTAPFLKILEIVEEEVRIRQAMDSLAAISNRILEKHARLRLAIDETWKRVEAGADLRGTCDACRPASGNEQGRSNAPDGADAE